MERYGCSGRNRKKKFGLPVGLRLPLVTQVTLILQGFREWKVRGQ